MIYDQERGISEMERHSALRRVAAVFLEIAREMGKGRLVGGESEPADTNRIRDNLERLEVEARIARRSFVDE